MRANALYTPSDGPARSREPHQMGERRARVRRMVQDARRVDHVERARPQTGPPEIGLDELHAIQPEAPRRRGAEPERGARQIGADDHAVRAGEVQAHLAGPAADLDDPRVAGD